MKYQFPCPCGKVVVVTAADAGATRSCACGRTVEVPPLHQLRAAAGQQVLSPAVRIEALLLEHKLPGTRVCVCCHKETDGLIRVRVQCQWAIVTKGGPSRADMAAGCFLFGWLAMFYIARTAPPGKEHGQDVVFVLPLPVCQACGPQLDDPAALRQALVAIPEYADLLAEYPHARVTRAK